MKKENVNKNSISWIWKVLGSEKYSIFLLLTVQVMFAVIGIAVVWVMRGLIDEAVLKNKNNFKQYMFFFVGLTILQIILRALMRFLEELSKSSIENRLKERLFTALMYKDYAAVTAVHTGEWMNRLTSDTVIVSDGVTMIIPQISGMCVKMAGALMMMLWLVPELACILIPGGILLIVFTYAFRKVLKQLHKNIQEADGKLRIFMTERLNSLLIIRSFVQEKQILTDAQQKMMNHKSARMRRNHFSNICNIGFSVGMRGAYVIGAVYSSYGILNGTISYGTLIAILQLIGQIQTPVANISGYLPKFYAMLASAERLMEVEDYQDEDRENVLPYEKIKNYYDESFEALSLEDVYFSYWTIEGEGGKTEKLSVLKDFTLKIEKGDYVAFTGPSGCGKSTILKLLMCLYPLDNGEKMLLTKYGKVPLNASWRGLYAYVPQGNQLMSGSIREIIAFGNSIRMKEDEKIWKSLGIACADGFVKELAEGIDTVLGEGGTGLSEGQMQRIAIARAVFSERPILLLDEATSSLDEETERRLLDNLRLMTNRTVLIVTHRLAVLDICDRNVVFAEDGIVVKEESKRKCQ